jgi:Helix-turn-helix domain
VITQPDEWLTIRQAAEKLGLSDLSVRRRIKDGRLAHRLINGKYLVNLAVAPVSPELGQADNTLDHPREYSKPPADQAHDQQDSHELASLLPAFAQLAERAGRAEMLAQRLREIEQREEELRDRMITLATRNGWLESRLEEREQTIKLLEDSRHRRGWWRRLFR